MDPLPTNERSHTFHNFSDQWFSMVGDEIVHCMPTIQYGAGT